MHRLSPKGPMPDCLCNFLRNNPTCHEWDSFYDNCHESYVELKKTIFEQQSYFCAYCEKKISPDEGFAQRIEHFHPKSHNDPSHNWTFDWMNMLGCCMGGTNAFGAHVLVSELHCDAYKELCTSETKTYFKGDLLNPLTMPQQCLFDIDCATGRLKPNDAVCSAVVVPDNNFASVSELVNKTIYFLNLNCPALNRDRRAVIKEFERLRKSMRQNPKANKTSIRTAIARRWFEGKGSEFFTTKRILLGNYAESFIYQ